MARAIRNRRRYKSLTADSMISKLQKLNSECCDIWVKLFGFVVDAKYLNVDKVRLDMLKKQGRITAEELNQISAFKAQETQQATCTLDYEVLREVSFAHGRLNLKSGSRLLPVERMDLHFDLDANILNDPLPKTRYINLASVIDKYRILNFDKARLVLLKWVKALEAIKSHLRAIQNQKETETKLTEAVYELLGIEEDDRKLKRYYFEAKERPSNFQFSLPVTADNVQLLESYVKVLSRSYQRHYVVDLPEEQHVSVPQPPVPHHVPRQQILQDDHQQQQHHQKSMAHAQPRQQQPLLAQQHVPQPVPVQFLQARLPQLQPVAPAQPVQQAMASMQAMQAMHQHHRHHHMHPHAMQGGQGMPYMAQMAQMTHGQMRAVQAMHHQQQQGRQRPAPGGPDVIIID